MRGLYSGLIAGCIGGVAITISMFTMTILGVYTLLSGIPLTFELLISHLAYAIGQNGVFGAIFGIMYSKFHRGVPGKGLAKGLVFGLIVYLFTNINAASINFVVWLFTSSEYHLATITSWVVTGFFVWIPYGVVLEALYERWK